MNRNTKLALLALLAGSLACTVPMGMTPTPYTVTQIVVVPDEVQPLPIPQSNATHTPTFTLVPVGTPTQTTTAIASPTSTLSGPIATFIKNANCRQGPGTSYEVVTSFETGTTVEIVGRNPDFDNTWWLVLIPDSNDKCWVSLVTAQATGDFDEIPTVIP